MDRWSIALLPVLILDNYRVQRRGRERQVTFRRLLRVSEAQRNVVNAPAFHVSWVTVSCAFSLRAAIGPDRTFGSGLRLKGRSRSSFTRNN